MVDAWSFTQVRYQFNVASGTQEVVASIMTRTDKSYERAHMLEKLAHRYNSRPTVMWSDTHPSGSKLLEATFPETLLRLGPWPAWWRWRSVLGGQGTVEGRRPCQLVFQIAARDPWVVPCGRHWMHRWKDAFTDGHAAIPSAMQALSNVVWVYN